ncbi:uncharacterized protein EV422DRAFT_497758, partial [Fimicolochytrium jonesii]|uniref:uncharacterized protein n=1 Tax=Fimicolochytrium jonesii TaxID=1396493 RepID=UPI0022FEDBB7
MLDVPSSPVNRERSQWQTMLASVLQGEVIRSEQRRISGTLTQKQQLDQRYQTWLGIRAYLRGRSVPEERQRIDERRVDAEAVLDEVLKFEVQKDSPKSPYDQVVDILTKVDKIESLYPSRNALILDKPLYAGSPFQHKMEALNSWLTISNSLRSQLKVLKNWAGSEDLLISRSQHPLSPDKRIETTFIERILKDGIKKTFEIQIMAFLRGLLAKSKAGMIENALVFKKMQLPTYINELQQLASFPSNLMEEILKVQVETHSQTATKHSGTVLDDLIESFGVSLQLAVRIKHECEDLDTRADGWSLANSLSPSYDVILLKSLKCYFTLLNWRLKSTTDTSFFKEAEMLENEWNFMSNLCFFIQGGDVETAVQFCQLEAELLRKVLNYLQKGMDGLGDPCVADGNFAMGGSGLVKWYARMWDNVKSRAGKLLQFQKMLVREFENAAEYTSDVPSPVLLRNFLHAGYSLVRTDAYANQGLYILASPSLHNRPECVSRLLRGCFARYEPFPSSIGKGYIIILPVSDRVRGSSGMNWQGRSMHVRIGKQIRPISLKSDRFRLVADTLEHLDVCKTLFEENINCKVKAVKLRRAHVQSVHDALKNTKGALVTLTEGIISSVKTVRDAINRGVHTAADLIEDMFTFASGFGLKALKYVGNRKKYDFMMKNLVKLSVDWVDFCAANCSLPAASVQHKTFKWNLRALYFAMNATSGTTIYLLADDEFEELKRGVGRCMRVLIKGFEQGGSISIAGVTATTPEEAVNALVANAARSASKLSSPHPPEAAPKSADSSKGSDMNLAGAAGVIRKQGAWMSAIEKLEEDREMRQLTNRMIGKVLDSSNIVDRNLSYLASTSSSISFRWQQGKFLGGGSFGSVYMAINLETADLMAVKEIRFTDVTSLETVQRAIKDEMNVLQLLHHPNIIEYYGVEVHRDKLYIFMEYCPQSIAQLIDHGGRFNDERATKVYAKQLLRGVEYLHNKGIVHRDIKPANTLLGQEGQIKYVDFGASKIYKTQKTVVVNGEANTLVGTPHYIAPEVITGESLGRHGAQDIWSMGCCVLEMVTGRKPWSGLDNEWAVMYHIGIANKMPPLPEPHELSEEGIDFLTKCFTRPASQRPSAKELLEHSWVKD